MNVITVYPHTQINIKTAMPVYLFTLISHQTIINHVRECYFCCAENKITWKKMFFQLAAMPPIDRE